MITTGSPPAPQDGRFRPRVGAQVAARADARPRPGHPDGRPPYSESQDLLAVVDTNVILDVVSLHDLSQTYERLGADGVDTPDAVYRRSRARESLLLAIYFHKAKAVTYSLHSEPVAILTTKVDPTSEDALETHYTKLFIHFVRKYG